MKNKFKVNDLVVFQFKKAQENYPDLITRIWNQHLTYPMIVTEIYTCGEYGDSLVFEHPKYNDISNAAVVFRKATKAEILKMKRG